MNTLLPDNYIYISHLDNIDDKNYCYWRLPCVPETIQDSMASNFGSSSALGRSAPVYTYSNSGPRTVQVSLALHRDMMDEINIGVSPAELGYGEDYIDNLINALQAISVPKYNLSNKAVEPPLVAMRLGRQIFIKGIVSGPIALEYALPLRRDGKYAQVRLSMTVTEVDPYDATTVFKNGSFRGVVKTMRKEMQ